MLDLRIVVKKEFSSSYFYLRDVTPDQVKKLVLHYMGLFPSKRNLFDVILSEDGVLIFCVQNTKAFCKIKMYEEEEILKLLSKKEEI